MSERRFWSAWSDCQIERQRWLITDPLLFSEFEVTRTPPAIAASAPIDLDIDLMTRPRQSGGTRLELFTDVFASTWLHAAAHRVVESHHDFGPALSSELLGVRTDGQFMYSLWSYRVESWLRQELSDGREVLVADVQDYFGSISSQRIALALRRILSEPAEFEIALEIVERLNGTPDASGATRSGLPISPNDFFWVAADLAFEDVDREIQALPGVESYVRWIDDLFIALSPGLADRVLSRLEQVLAGHGLLLNTSKTRHLARAADFEREFFVPEHESLDTLFNTSRRGFLPTQPDYLRSLLRSLGPGIQEARLVKRAYSLAALAATPTLIDRAARDLAAFPTAEVPILAYLGSLGWPAECADVVEAGLESPPADSRLLALLRTLIRFPPSTGRLETLLRPLEPSLGGNGEGHPFGVPLTLGLLLCAGSSHTQAAAARVLGSVDGLPSATARRLAYEILLAVPKTRRAALEALAEDRSPTVRGLLKIIRAPKSAASPWRLLSLLPAGTSHRLSWGKLTGLLARAVLPAELLERPGPT